MDKIYAPFPEELVEFLKNSTVCPENHSLDITSEGLFCEKCNFKQNWVVNSFVNRLIFSLAQFTEDLKKNDLSGYNKTLIGKKGKFIVKELVKKVNSL